MTQQTIGICGSGIMGSGIAQVVATAGYETILRSRSMKSAGDSRNQILRRLERSVAKQTISSDRAAEIMDRIRITDDLHDLHEVDIVIESVVEDLEVKRDLFVRLDDICQADAILTTNTSTLAVIELAMATERPDQVCGLHFFNPAPAMQAVELVRPLTASEETMQTARSVAEACGKEAILVKDEAGFVVNNLLFPYLNRAVALVGRGTCDTQGVDSAMRGGCGFPMGPLELLDLIGLDTTVAILDALYEEFHDECCSAEPTLRRMVTAGQLGRKSGQGFYSYP
jgi:3-hydroxybutyryl-CoA dehydrogenase